MRNYNSYTPRSLRKLQRNTRKKLIFTIIFAIFLGFALINWGLPNLIGGLVAINRLKSHPKPADLAENPAIAPPVLNIPFDATNSATLNLTGYSTPNSRVEIYIDDELKTTVDANSDGNFSVDNLSLSEGTNNIYGKTLDDNASNKSLPSKTIRLVYSNEKPKLEIIEPNDGTQIKGGDKKIKVSGNTDNQASLTINNQTIIVNGEGHFSTDIPLNDGDNTISVVSTNTVGNSTKIERKVNYSAS